MGRTVCAAVAADPDLVFAAAVDPFGVGETVEGVAVSEHLHAFADAACDVVVDFTVADAARNTLPWLGMHGIHAVVGTTGFTDADFELFESTFGECERPELCDRSELRDLRGADDAVRRDGGTVLRHRRDHRAAPRPQDRCPVGNGREDRRAHGCCEDRGLRPGPDDGRRLRGCAWRRGPLRGSGSTRCACAAWWPTRRSSSAPPARR